MNNADQDVQHPRQPKPRTPAALEDGGPTDIAEAILDGRVILAGDAGARVAIVARDATEAAEVFAGLVAEGFKTNTAKPGDEAWLDQHLVAAATGRAASTPLRDCGWLRERLEAAVLALPPDGALLEQVRSYTVYDEPPPPDQLEPGASMTGISGSLESPIRSPRERETAGSACATYVDAGYDPDYDACFECGATAAEHDEHPVEMLPGERIALLLGGEFRGRVSAGHGYFGTVSSEPPKFHSGGIVLGPGEHIAGPPPEGRLTAVPDTHFIDPLNLPAPTEFHRGGIVEPGSVVLLGIDHGAPPGSGCKATVAVRGPDGPYTILDEPPPAEAYDPGAQAQGIRGLAGIFALACAFGADDTRRAALHPQQLRDIQASAPRPRKPKPAMTPKGRRLRRLRLDRRGF